MGCAIIITAVIKGLQNVGLIGYPQPNVRPVNADIAAVREDYGARIDELEERLSMLTTGANPSTESANADGNEPETSTENAGEKTPE